MRFAPTVRASFCYRTQRSKTAASTIRVLNLFQSLSIDALRHYNKFSSRLVRDFPDSVDTSSIHFENISLRSATRAWSEAA